MTNLSNKEIRKGIWNEAAEVIEKYGWVQRHFGNKDCGFCIMGAVGQARNDFFKKHAKDTTQFGANDLLWDRCYDRSVGMADLTLFETIKYYGWKSILTYRNVVGLNDTTLKTKQEAIDFCRNRGK